MKSLHPFQLTKTAVANTPTRLVAAPRCVSSAQIVPKVGNASAVLIGTLDELAAPNPKTEIPLVLPISHGLVYELYDLYFKTASDGDGVEIFGFE